MEPNDVEKKLDAADGILTKTKTILKKHWGILLFLLFSYCVYWAFTQPQPTTPPKIEYIQPVDTVYVSEPDSTEADTAVAE